MNSFNSYKNYYNQLREQLQETASSELKQLILFNINIGCKRVGRETVKRFKMFQTH